MTFGSIAVVGILLAVASASQAAGRTLVQNGRSEYRIVLPPGSSPSEHRAAVELKHFITQISGATMPIVPERTGPSILIGSKAAPPGVDLSGLGDEGFIIKTVGQDLLIAGGRFRGTMYGVYAFLGDVLGCRWYSSKVSRIPRLSTVRISELDVREIPAFEYRDVFYTDAFDRDWAARNRTNGATARLDRTTGGKISYHHFVHTFADLVPLAKYWDTHPEYYSMINGKRIRDHTQLCLTNPDVLKIATETVLGWIREAPEAKIYSVSQNDWYNNCQCDNCKAVDEEEGSPSGTLLRFVNAIAAEVARQYPYKLIDTLAYQYTEVPPKITRPAENVRVRLCPIFACESHPYEKCPENAKVVSNLKAWSAITDNLYIWHYNTDFSHYLIPFPDFEELAADADLYKRNGVKGIFWEGNYSPGGGGELAELRAWVLAKLSWNPKADVNALVNDFMQGYYGAAAPHIRAYFDLLHREVREKNIHMRIWMGPTEPLFSPEVIAESVRLFDLAEKAVAREPDVLHRVRQARLGIDYVQLMQPIVKKETKGREKELLSRLDALVSRCREYGITHISEGEGLDAFSARIRKELGAA